MNWKQLSFNADLISYEKRHDKVKIRIEARLDEENSWAVYKTYNYMGETFVEEYKAKSRQDMENILKELKDERDLSIQEVKQILKLRKSDLQLKPKRSYKDYDVEKWFFSINNEPGINFVIIKYGPSMVLDIILRSKYKFVEPKIVEELIKLLGLNEFEDLQKNVYFYDKSIHDSSSQAGRGMFIGKIGLELRLDDS